MKCVVHHQALQCSNEYRQVQDLEKQLDNAKHEVQRLQQIRSGMARPADDLMDIDDPGQPLPKLPEIGYRPPRRPRVPLAQDLSAVRSNLRNYGRGILTVPAPYRQPGAESLVAESPELPPKHVADHLLAQYYSTIHSIFPVMHWPSFTRDYESVYRAGSLRGYSREWTAALFAVFACGAIHTLDPNRDKVGKDYVTIATSACDVWLEDFTLDRVRFALLASIVTYEVGLKSPSWVWIGSGIRIAQEIGLHIDSGPWSAVEGEMRKRVWWGIYAWDRYDQPWSIVLC